MDVSVDETSENTPTKGEVLLHIQKLYFSMIPLRKYPKTITLSTIQLLKSEENFLDFILKGTILHEICLSHPTSISSQRSFLKWLIEISEKFQGEETLDTDLLFDLHTKVLSTKEQLDFCYKTYIYSPYHITLIESLTFISHGTTGLTSWTAAFLLNEWILNNETLLTGRNVLELGSGSGLTGILTILASNPKSFKFSDCHSKVLTILDSNVRNNVPKTFEKQVEIVDLDWTTFEDSFVKTNLMRDLHLPDVILGADLVFDENVIPFLVVVLKFMLSATNIKSTKSSQDNLIIPSAYIASTIRNPKTFNCFQHFLTSSGMYYEEVPIAKFMSSVFLSTGFDDNPILSLLKIQDIARRDEQELNMTFLPRTLSNCLATIDFTS